MASPVMVEHINPFIWGTVTLSFPKITTLKVVPEFIGNNHDVQGGKDVIPLALPIESQLGNVSLIVGFKSEA